MIQDGQLDSAKLSVLEDIDLSADLKGKYVDPLKSLGLYVSNWIVTVGLEKLSLGRVAISITVSSEAVQIGVERIRQGGHAQYRVLAQEPRDRRAVVTAAQVL